MPRHPKARRVKWTTALTALMALPGCNRHIQVDGDTMPPAWKAAIAAQLLFQEVPEGCAMLLVLEDEASTRLCECRGGAESRREFVLSDASDAAPVCGVRELGSALWQDNLERALDEGVTRLKATEPCVVLWCLPQSRGRPAVEAFAMKSAIPVYPSSEWPATATNEPAGSRGGDAPPAR